MCTTHGRCKTAVFSCTKRKEHPHYDEFPDCLAVLNVHTQLLQNSCLEFNGESQTWLTTKEICNSSGTSCKKQMASCVQASLQRIMVIHDIFNPYNHWSSSRSVIRQKMICLFQLRYEFLVPLVTAYTFLRMLQSTGNDASRKGWKTKVNRQSNNIQADRQVKGFLELSGPAKKHSH